MKMVPIYGYGANVAKHIQKSKSAWKQIKNWIWLGKTTNIKESVDSICRDSADMQYMLISQNLQHPTILLRVFS